MMEFGGVMTELLDSRPKLRIILVYPILRTNPPHFKSDLVHLRVCFAFWY